MEYIISANKQLNEWCGTSAINYYEGITALGFLFKYAVEGKLKEMKLELEHRVDYGDIDWGRGQKHYYAILRGSHHLLSTYEDQDPALALFWAIYSIIDKSPPL